MTGIMLGLALLAGARFDWPAVAVFTGVVAVGFCMAQRLRLAVGIALVGASALGAWRVEPIAERSIGPERISQIAFRGRVANGPVQTGRFARFTLAETTGLTICASAPLAPRAVRGDQVVVHGTLEPVEDALPATAAYLRSRGCDGGLFAHELVVLKAGGGVETALDRFRQSLTGALHAAYGGDTGALLSGLVTGDDAFLAKEQRDAFVATGTTHLTAVSGSNLAVLVTMVALLGTWVGGRRTAAWQALTVTGIWLYVATIGAPPPALRAAVVATLAIIAARLGRRADFVTLGVLVAAVEVIVRPADFWMLSYRLSTVATLGIVLGLSGRRVSGWRDGIAAALVATTAAQIATTPVLIDSFGMVSPWSIPANLAVGPLCAAALPIAMIASLGGLLHPDVAAVVAAPAALLARLVLAIVAGVAGLPGSGAGQARIGQAWIWPVALGSMAAIAGMSAECRDGARRLAVDARRLSRHDAAIAIGGMAGAVVALVVLVLR